MLNLKFLNVNQGDSIVIQYNNDLLVQKTIVVDCNNCIDGNKTIAFLAENGITEIETIILSHFHYDHYSGFFELLGFCKDNNIRLGWVHLTGKLDPNYLRAITRKSKEASEEVIKILKRLDEYQKLGLLQYGFVEETGQSRSLNSKMHLTYLSPSTAEDRYFLKSIKLESYANSDIRNHPAANLMSTVIKIEGEDWYILLTGDSMKSTLVRLDIQKKTGNGKRLLLGQASHHGALTSHNNTFWKKQCTSTKSKIVFSVGQNIYNHPSKEAVDFFLANNFEIYSTNKVGYLNFLKPPTTAAHISHMNVFTAPSTSAYKDPKLNGDKGFYINTQGEIFDI